MSRRRRVLDGDWMLRKVLALDSPCAVVAFEIDDERTIVRHCGITAWDSWFRSLVSAVEDIADANDWVATWKNRYVLVALQSGKPAERLRTRVLAAWTQFVSETIDAAGVAPRLRHAALEPGAIRGERALDRLVERLLWHPDELKQTTEQSLPFPIAVTPAVVASRRTAFGRVNALVWGIEVALRFLLAVFLSELREKDDGSIASDLARLIAPNINRPLSLGKTAEITAHLAQMVLQMNSPIAPLAQNVLISRGKKARLPTKLWTAIQRRNWNAHGPGLPEETYHEDETLLSEAFQVLTLAMAPLASARLASVQEIVQFGFDGEVVYSMRSHQGASEHFPVAPFTSKHLLHMPWCYLFCSDHGPPLLLAPFFAAQICQKCRRTEMFVGDQIQLGPKNEPSVLRGITTNHDTTVPLPWTHACQRLHENMQTASPADAGIAADRSHFREPGARRAK